MFGKHRRNHIKRALFRRKLRVLHGLQVEVRVDRPEVPGPECGVQEVAEICLIQRIQANQAQAEKRLVVPVSVMMIDSHHRGKSLFFVRILAEDLGKHVLCRFIITGVKQSSGLGIISILADILDRVKETGTKTEQKDQKETAEDQNAFRRQTNAAHFDGTGLFFFYYFIVTLKKKIEPGGVPVLFLHFLP